MSIKKQAVLRVTRNTAAQSERSPQAPHQNVYDVNVGEGIDFTGIVIVTMDGNIVCEQPLANAETVIDPNNVFLSTTYTEIEEGDFDLNVNLAVNPVAFAFDQPGTYELDMTGTACTKYLPGPSTVSSTWNVATSAVATYPGAIPLQPICVNGFFNFDFANGAQGRITFGNISNNTSATANYGILQIVTKSQRFATLADETVQYIANFNQNALDDLNGVTMSPTQENVAPGASPFSLTLMDGPGFQVVPQWMVGGVLKNIAWYELDDAYSAYLMYQSQNGGAWVPVAQINWAIKGVVVRAPNGWIVDFIQTEVTQPNVGIPNPPLLTWQGVAQDNVLATVVNNQYYIANPNGSGTVDRAVVWYPRGKARVPKPA